MPSNRAKASAQGNNEKSIVDVLDTEHPETLVVQAKLPQCPAATSASKPRAAHKQLTPSLQGTEPTEYADQVCNWHVPAVKHRLAQM